MKFANMISTVDTHTQGEPTRIILSGTGFIPGSSMLEKKQWMSDHRDSLRQMLMHEPRGHQDMFGAVITEPCHPEAQAGVVFMDGEGYLDMCGHGSMGVVTALLETGMVTVNQGQQEVSIQLDTPAGMIHGKAALNEQGQVLHVTIRNQPAYWVTKIHVDVPPLGEIPVNIAYGGNYFALVDVEHLNLTVEPRHLDELKKLGIAIREAVNQEVHITHPATGLAATVALTEIYQNTNPARNVVIFGVGQIDRSPCGTGTSAKMAFLHHSEKLAVGETYPYQSVFGTEFLGKIIQETQIGDTRGVIPEITGNAYVTGFHQFIADPNDPYQYGFNVG